MFGVQCNAHTLKAVYVFGMLLVSTDALLVLKVCRVH